MAPLHGGGAHHPAGRRPLPRRARAHRRTARPSCGSAARSATGAASRSSGRGIRTRTARTLARELATRPRPGGRLGRLGRRARDRRGRARGRARRGRPHRRGARHGRRRALPGLAPARSSSGCSRRAARSCRSCRTGRPGFRRQLPAPEPDRLRALRGGRGRPAGEKSGALITAELGARRRACRCSRCPGDVRDPLSAGPPALLRARRARGRVGGRTCSTRSGIDGRSRRERQLALPALGGDECALLVRARAAAAPRRRGRARGRPRAGRRARGAAHARARRVCASSAPAITFCAAPRGDGWRKRRRTEGREGAKKAKAADAP